MTYVELFEIVLEECDEDCENCILEKTCKEYDITIEKLKQYLIECEKVL